MSIKLRCTRRVSFVLALGAVFGAGLARDVRAQGVAEFYAGKTVRIVIGFGMGGGYGQYALLASKFIGKHMPGEPNVIVQSMPGAGGVQSLIYMANVAPQDGTALTLISPNVLQEGMLAVPPPYDPSKFQWIGRLDRLVQVAVTSARSKVRSIADARLRTAIAGGAGVQDQSSLSARILNDMARTKFNVVAGYKGTAEVEIAWQRGEVEVWTAGWDFIKARYKKGLEGEEIVPLYVYAMQRVPDLPQVPAVAEFGRNPAEETFLRIYTAGSEIGRGLAAPAGIPLERLEAWRTALSKTLADPEFKAAAAKGDMSLDPLDGTALAKVVSAVLALPELSIESARQYYRKLLDEAK